MAESGRLAGKVAIITGGTSGIGQAVALLFAGEGARIVINGRNEERGHQVVEDIRQAGGQAEFVRADVRRAKDCRRTVDEAVRTFGGLDILVNNAGVLFSHTVPDCTEAEWDLTLDINLKGAFLMSKDALRVMLPRQSGTIINVSSGWGLVGGAAAAAYCASKGGMVLLTKAMAIDHGRQGIRVNCICPGDVDTPMLPGDALLRGLAWDDYRAEAANRPLGRIGQPQEIARAALFLATDDSSFITGAALAVDGGGTAD
jgi:NAD(P)-dependent dehydrogenase (short-subunit alcohol dehydrogenase family)